MAQIKWKTKAEIEEEKNKPRELTEIDQLRLEQAQANAEMIDLVMAMTMGGM